MIVRNTLLCLVCLSISYPASIMAQTLETDSIPSSAVGAIFIKPKEMFAQPSMELIPHEIITAYGVQELGFDPMEITRLSMVVDSFEDLREPPGFAIVLEFDSPQTLSEKLTERLEEGEREGRPLYSTGERGVVYLPDDQTIIFAMESFLDDMQSSAGTDGPLTSLIESTGSSAEIQVYFVLEPVRQLVNDNLPPPAQVPPPFVEFLEIPNLVENVVTEISFSENSYAQLKIGAHDAAAAARIDEILSQAMRVGQQAVLGQVMQEMQNQSPAVQRAFAQYINRVGDYVQTHMRPAIDGSQLVFRGEDDTQVMALASVGVLTGLLLPAVQQVREAARRTDSMNNLRQIALACLNYESAYRRLPTDIVSEDGEPLLSWRVAILPYLEQNNLYDQFRLDEPWDSEHNIQLLDQMPVIFQNANVMLDNRTVYQGFKGPGTIFEGQQVRFRDLTDGSSNTILCVESDMDAAVEWSRPADLPFDPAGPVTGIGNLRPSGFNAAFADGSVRTIARGLDREVLRNLIQMNDGQVIPQGEMDRPRPTKTSID